MPSHFALQYLILYWEKKRHKYEKAKYKNIVFDGISAHSGEFVCVFPDVLSPTVGLLKGFPLNLTFESIVNSVGLPYIDL
jgi:hypothetical protein